MDRLGVPQVHKHGEFISMVDSSIENHGCEGRSRACIRWSRRPYTLMRRLARISPMDARANRCRNLVCGRTGWRQWDFSSATSRAASNV